MTFQYALLSDFSSEVKFNQIVITAIKFTLSPSTEKIHTLFIVPEAKIREKTNTCQ